MTIFYLDVTFESPRVCYAGVTDPDQGEKTAAGDEKLVKKKEKKPRAEVRIFSELLATLFGSVINSQVPSKISFPLWKLINDCSYFQKIYLLLKNVGYDFFFLLVHFVILKHRK